MSPFLWHDLARLWRDGWHDSPAPSSEEEREITSVQEMAALTTRMRTVVERALGAGKQVKAQVRVEVK